MATREMPNKLKNLLENGANVYSISRINAIDQCLYQAYNTYILNKRGMNNVYGILGSRIHDVLEKIINGEATASDLYPALNSELEDLDMLSLNFPKDMKGNDTIRTNWIADMTHFCENFQKPEGRFSTEELVLYKLKDNRYIQGYIDLIRYNDDGTISIFDWKTSSKFNKSDLLHHGRQLIFYALAKEAEGYIVRDVAWYMMKYVEVSYMGKKRANSKAESLITKVVNRGKIVRELKENIKTDLFNLGYEEIDIEFLIDEALEKNSLDCLPKEIINKYKISPYIQNYDLTEDLKRECLEYINSRADLFEGLDTSNPDDFPPMKFTKVNSKGQEVDDTFFCSALCSHRNTCKHLLDYRNMKNLKDDNWESNLF